MQNELNSNITGSNMHRNYAICMQTTFLIQFSQMFITELIAFNIDVIKAQKEDEEG